MMIKCPFCQAAHVRNTIFCSECGNYLLEDDKPATVPLDIDDTDWVSHATGDPGDGSSVQQEIRSQAIRLKIGAGKREVEMPLIKPINVGRVDPASTVFPEIDLTNDGTLAKSVSRRHARILKHGDAVVVEDLGSINGTFINGERLDPYLPQTLSDGDTLQLGKLLIGVKIRQR